ncbi:bifunctional demethylmenaquinone methyltransferase/2-methoxy-6-polyprenyl-1,4-benzoquinol methylase UbiE [Parvularcula sp. IMCC14364]|uniref:bifunctional demethylmenaquinone methyltransferase/2-methoxy-6-polyprenyl-1,4-benzoquinol methylase UbiE n=1 Tax=Parvularcula sp. IMCC14364 TaxID=3067902 RepID=UPI00274050D7|nr:bifunctional demethylmenaquinone methyltransferase/2-methoxy-6-polyprenyl-1,4-benzoquinol methylase UbiE [Parvularcula sp. IMCC14364]
MTDTQEQTASFGFQDVPATEKEGMVRAVFDSVADNYDLMNDLMSAGIHRVWKSLLLDRLNPQPGQHLLDVAGGTGDIALGFLKRAGERPERGRIPASATVCDINHAMLKAGRTRDEAQDAKGQITRSCGDAQNLPFPDRSFDAYTIGFGIRNVTDMDQALTEAYRVLRPGGHFFCLEFSHPITDGFQKVYDSYSFNVIPWLGEKVANDRESYQYLVESIRRFPSQEAFADKIRRAGFSRVGYENLSGGIAALHTGWRL